MRLSDLVLTEYVDKFGKMTLPYYMKYIEDLTGKKADWIDKSNWTNHNAMFNKFVASGKITGQEANSRYWIRQFRDDFKKVGEFIQFIKSVE